MLRMQIQLTEDQADRLRRAAVRQNRSIASVVRDAVDRFLAEPGAVAARQRAVEGIGGFRSGRGDIAEHHDRYLADDFAS